jgi:DNA-binding NarL/FixJ family response regulator
MPMLTGPTLRSLGAQAEQRMALDAASPLTAREVEVIELVSAGATNNEIASALVISESTVKSHVKHILRKLGAANRAEAVSRHLSSMDE